VKDDRPRDHSDDCRNKWTARVPAAKRADDQDDTGSSQHAHGDDHQCARSPLSRSRCATIRKVGPKYIVESACARPRAGRANGNKNRKQARRVARCPGVAGAFGHHMSMNSGVPVQYFQSIIAAQLAVAGALLFQVRFFDTSNGRSGSQVDPRLRLVLVVVIAATLFVSLEAIREGWGSAAAALVAGGLALSVLPILLRVLPPLTRDIETQKRDPHLWITVLAVILYFAIVTIVVLIR
jgi:hypothetical protein